MKFLTTLTFFLFISFPAFSCPFHGAFFYGDDDTDLAKNAFAKNVKAENPKTIAPIRLKSFSPIQNFSAHLKPSKVDK